MMMANGAFRTLKHYILILGARYEPGRGIGAGILCKIRVVRVVHPQGLGGCALKPAGNDKAGQAAFNHCGGRGDGGKGGSALLVNGKGGDGRWQSGFKACQTGDIASAANAVPANYHICLMQRIFPCQFPQHGSAQLFSRDMPVGAVLYSDIASQPA